MDDHKYSLLDISGCRCQQLKEISHASYKATCRRYQEHDIEPKAHTIAFL